jgi:putative phage-type endonuclease
MHDSDSDYNSQVVSDTETDESINSSIEDEDEDEAFEMTEQDWQDLYEVIDELIYDIIRENLTQLSNVNIYKDIAASIFDIIYETIGHLFDDSADPVFHDIQDLIEQIVELEMDILHIPKRSLTMTIDTLTELSDATIQATTLQIEKLRNTPQPQQKSPEWYKFRYNLLSASNLWKALGSDAQRNSLIYEKCKPLDTGLMVQYNTITSGPMHWGVKYEPLTVMIYEDMYKTTVEEFGCIQHPKYKCIGASPDGIIIDPSNIRYGRMLEIKNIVNREITGIPKIEYWVQTQIQMETCDLDTCDFVETRFKEYNEAEFFKDTEREYKGVILHFIEKPMILNGGIDIHSYKPTLPVYVYKPFDVENTPEDISIWIEQEKEHQENKNNVLFSVNYWYMDEFSCVLIQRNRLWFESAVPSIQQLWETIEKERIDGYEHRAAKKRTPKVPSLMNDMSEASIANIHSKPNLCLIRLDENGDVI